MMKFDIDQKYDNQIKPCFGDNELVSLEIHSKINLQDFKENFRRKATLTEADNSPKADNRGKSNSLSRKKESNMKESVIKRTFSIKRSQTLKDENQSISNSFKKYTSMKKKENKINLNVFDFFSKKNRKSFINKVKALKAANSKIDNDLDILNIIEKFQEIDMLKLILFTKEQLMLFNLIAKLEIFIEDKENQLNDNPDVMISSYLKGFDKKNDENCVDLAVYYNKIKNNRKIIKSCFSPNNIIF